MNDTIIGGIIALSGIFISVISSIFISIHRSKMESQKIRNELFHRYSGEIFKNRLGAYPKIIEHLVRIFQKINLYKIKNDTLYELKIKDIENLFEEILKWDTENSTLYSAELQNVMHHTYHNLYHIITKSHDELEASFKKVDFLLELRNELFKFYLALKNDLGVYSFKSPSTITEFKSPDTVIDFSRLIK